MRFRGYTLLLFGFALERFAFAEVPQPLGAEFRVNTYTTGVQAEPKVAGLGHGKFVVVWHSFGQDGDDGGVFGQLHDSAGMPEGSEFQVNTYTTGDQVGPVVSSDDGGRFVVAWGSVGLLAGQDGDSWGVFAQLYDSLGKPAGSEFQVNVFTTGAQSGPVMAKAPGGHFVISWFSFDQNTIYGSFWRRYSVRAIPQGAETRFSGVPPSALSIDRSGNRLLASLRSSLEGTSSSIVVRRYDSFGNPLNALLRVNTDQDNMQQAPALGCNPIGECAIVWTSAPRSGSTPDPGRDGSGWGIFARRFDSVGNPRGQQFQVNDYTLGDQTSPSVWMGPHGNLVVVWEEQGLPICDRICVPGPSRDGSGSGLFGKVLDSEGASVSSEFQVNTFTNGDQRTASVVASGDQLLVVWVSTGTDGSELGVFGQRFLLRTEPLTVGTETRRSPVQKALLWAVFLVLGSWLCHRAFREGGASDAETCDAWQARSH